MVEGESVVEGENVVEGESVVEGENVVEATGVEGENDESEGDLSDEDSVNSSDLSDDDSDKSNLGEDNLIYEKQNNENGLEEIKLDIEKSANLDGIEIKSASEVYYDLYLEAKNKAKHTRQEAIKAYLNLKKIGNLIKLDELNNSDDELDVADLY